MSIVVLIVATVCVLFEQKTAYELRISDWSSDVCSSDLSPGFLFPRHRLVSSGGRAAKPVAATHGTRCAVGGGTVGGAVVPRRPVPQRPGRQIGRASCRERVCQYV